MLNIPRHKYFQKSSAKIFPRKCLIFHDRNCSRNCPKKYSPRKCFTFHDINILINFPRNSMLGAPPQKFLIWGHDWFWPCLKIHWSDMHDSNIWVVSHIVVSNDPIVMLSWPMVLGKFVLKFRFLENQDFWNFRGAVPGMCSPKWNLRWYSDSWDIFGKMTYIYVKVRISLRKEVMRLKS